MHLFICFFKTQNYLKNNSYGNAEQSDLWAALDAQAKEDTTLSVDLTVGDIMNTWTLQKGYPVVHVKRLSPTQLSVSQKYFLLNPLNSLQSNTNTTEYDSYKWYVPFTYTTKVNPNFDFESETQWLKPSVSSCKFKKKLNQQKHDFI